MSSLPPGDLIPGPQMMSVSFSLAGLAFADTREEKTGELAKFQSALKELRTGFATLRKYCEQMRPEADTLDPSQLRSLLDYSAFVEEGLLNLERLIGRFSKKEKFEEIFGSAVEDMRQVSKELQAEFVPFVREIRLQTICIIAERASAAGVSVMDTSDDFRSSFRKASFEETTGWQETAYIMANIDGAKRLSEAIASAPKTEEFLSPPTAGHSSN